MKYGHVGLHYIFDIGGKAAEHRLHIVIFKGNCSIRKIPFLLPFRPGHKAGPQTGSCKTGEFPVEIIGYTAHRLGRRIDGKHIKEIVPFLLFIPDTPPAFAGGHICQHCVQFLIFFQNINQVIVGLIGNGIFKKNGARRDDTDHIPLHQPLCLLRILQLLTDGHLVALLDQTVNINFRCMKWNAAHRHPSLGACVLPGKRKLQFMGCSHSIVIKKLIEIAQPVKKKTVLILVLHLFILFHQRRFRHVITPFCWLDCLREALIQSLSAFILGFYAMQGMGQRE